MDKQTIRISKITALQNLSPEKRAIYNDDLLKQLVESREWKGATTIAVTLSRFPEVNTDLIIRTAWQAKKTIAIPYSGPSRQLSFYEYTPETKLEKSKFGLWEPADRESPLQKTGLDFILVPGLAFSQEGYRIGFGGGYYDRYLEAFSGMTASLLYPFQIDEQVSSLIEPFDIPIQKLFIASE